jgi:putative Mg2+ transporter-C (MgtC) family protein
MTIDPTLDIVLRLVAATFAGGVIGLNREMRHKPAGLRTHAVVALGAALAASIFATAPAGTAAWDINAMSRIIQGIITGIGFIGAGVILRSPGGHAVHGLTTAASIWLAACIGCACGAGAWVPALVALALVLLILMFGGPLEHWVTHKLSPPAEPDDPPAL